MVMRRLHLTIPAFLLGMGAATAMAQSVQVITPAPAPVMVPSGTVVLAPNAPPPPRVETIPPPPSEAARVMYWRPGHWMWDGASWSWAEGQYMSRPSPAAVWEPGRWVQQPTGGYVWVDGRWAG